VRAEEFSPAFLLSLRENYIAVIEANKRCGMLIAKQTAVKIDNK
jgi:hypothetical protein